MSLPILQASPTLDTLSNDTLLNIISHLADDAASASIRSLSLTSRRMHHLASPHVFVHFTITDESIRKLRQLLKCATSLGKEKKRGTIKDRERARFTFEDLKRTKVVTMREVPNVRALRRMQAVMRELDMDILFPEVHSAHVALHESEEKRLGRLGRKQRDTLRDGVHTLADLFRPRQLHLTGQGCWLVTQDMILPAMKTWLKAGLETITDHSGSDSFRDLIKIAVRFDDKRTLIHRCQQDSTLSTASEDSFSVAWHRIVIFGLTARSAKVAIELHLQAIPRDAFARLSEWLGPYQGIPTGSLGDDTIYWGNLKIFNGSRIHE